MCLSASRPEGSDLSLPVIRYALKELVQKEGGATPLQLSGGEPTLHKDLVKIVECSASLGFEKIEIDTNGLVLGCDLSLCEKLKNVGLTGIYLQMDGLHPSVSESIRSRDLVDEKLRTIENCKKAGLQVVLAATVVPGVNDDSLWEMIQFGMDERVTGVNFQSLTLSGRYPERFALSSERFTLGHFLRKVEEQSHKRLSACDLIPIPCPDPRCGVLTYALIHKGELVPLTRLLEREKLLAPTAYLSDWQTLLRQINCEMSCGCEATSLLSDSPVDMGDILADSDFFSVGFHGMMDVYNFDLDRARRCCVHQLTPEGKLIPFCLYNIKYRENQCNS